MTLTQPPVSQHHHTPPPQGVAQPLAPVTSPQAQLSPSRSLGFVNINNRLYAPLYGLDPNNVSQGGYTWLSPTDGGATYHPGVNLNAGGACNADEGSPVIAPLAGFVAAMFRWNGHSSGEGNHLWFQMDDPCAPGYSLMHIDHLLNFSPSIREGQRLAPGDKIGECGRTGGWACAHLHTEILKGPPRDGWWQWPYRWSRAQVQAAYYDPSQWWAAATALVLAESNHPIPPETVMLLTDWQLKNWILPELYLWASIPYNPESGTAQGWVNSLRAGNYLGRPRTTDRPYGEGDDAGVWVEFDHGILCYRSRDGESSWRG